MGWGGLEEMVANRNLPSPAGGICHEVLIPTNYVQASNCWVHFSWSVHSVTGLKGKAKEIGGGPKCSYSQDKRQDKGGKQRTGFY